MKKLLLMSLSILTLAARAAVTETAKDWMRDPTLNGVYLNLNYHHEIRDGYTGNHGELILGYDRLLFPEAAIYAGVRTGLYQENLLTRVYTTQTKPFFGAQVYKLFNTGALTLKTGVYCDVLKGDDNDPLYGGLGLEIAPRWNIPTTQNIYLEIPVGFEFFPAFDGLPKFFKIGVQLGYNF